MISKKNRATSEMVSMVFKQGKILTSNALFSCRFINIESDHPRFSFIAPKTIFKTAAARNNVRRKWYSSLPKEINKCGLYIFTLKNGSQVVGIDERVKSLSFLK